MKSFIELAAPGVQKLTPYQPGKPIEELQREYGVDQVVKLASNENPLGPGPGALKAIGNELSELSRYPDGNGFVLKQALIEKLASEQVEVSADRITLGNGSNDILEFLAHTFVTPDDEVMFSRHAFAVYPLVTQAVNARAVVVPARNWGHDLDAMQAAITDKTRLIFIANPNNPTGTWLDAAELHQFVASVPSRVIVAVDEAYLEYARDIRLGAEGYDSAMAWLDEYPNLVVTRTFSKAYGLAGLRVGYSVSHPEVADLLNRVRQPFNVNSLALVAAKAALSDKDHLEKSVDCNAKGMQQLTQGFERLGLEYIPSVGNFVCVNVVGGGQTSMAVYDRLLHEGVIVRPVANYEMPDYLRVTVGTETENLSFLTALEKVMQS